MSDAAEVKGFVLCVLVGVSLVRVRSESGVTFLKWLVWNNGLVVSHESLDVFTGLLESTPTKSTAQ